MKSEKYGRMIFKPVEFEGVKTAKLKVQFAESDRLDAEIVKNLAGLGYGV